MTKSLFIKTYGCQMNVYDSARMADVLAPEGYRLCDSPDDADVVVLNTCHIREKAAEKVYSELGRIRALQSARHARGKGMRIAVAGCVAQVEGAEMRRRAPFVDLVVGPQAIHRLGDLLAGLDDGGSRVDTEFPAVAKFDGFPETAQSGVTAFLTVQEGCDKFCTFCVVPYTRGAEFSRPAADIDAEARRLVALGAREITLLGQNVNAYHGAGEDGAPGSLGTLIRRLAEIEGLARIRYTTSHPLDVDADLLAAHRDVAALMPYVHLPAQSGSDAVLRAMNRRHTAGDYLRVVDALRAARADLALSADFIVGFPGETDADFRDTVRLVEDVGYADAFSFRYSPRPGTPAADMPQMPEPVKAERLAELQSVLARQRSSFDAATVGRVLPVLLDKPGRHPGQLGGRSPYLQAVHMAAPSSLLGTIADVEIRAVGPNSLAGVLPSRAGSALEARLAS